VKAYALDTNAAISLLNGTSSKLKARLFAQTRGAVTLPAIVAHELYWGAFRSGRVDYNLEKLRILAGSLPILDFDVDDARVSGQIRATLFARGTPIGTYDTLIAGQAKARSLTVITNNLREFTRVDGLKVEDWTV
jgi:tRNA(fMet)-specific endonuclease VapC